MNPDFSQLSREDLEVRVTAFLLDELTPPEADAMRQVLAQDPELARLQQQLKITIELVRAALVSAGEKTTPSSVPVQLSPDRREKLLQQFKVTAPKELVGPSRRTFNWYIPASLAALLMILATLFVPKLANRSELGRMSSNLAQLEPDATGPNWAWEQNGRAFTEKAGQSERRKAGPTPTKAPATKPEGAARLNNWRFGAFAPPPMATPAPSAIRGSEVASEGRTSGRLQPQVRQSAEPKSGPSDTAHFSSTLSSRDGWAENRVRGLEEKPGGQPGSTTAGGGFGGGIHGGNGTITAGGSGQGGRGGMGGSGGQTAGDVVDREIAKRLDETLVPPKVAGFAVRGARVGGDDQNADLYAPKAVNRPEDANAPARPMMMMMMRSPSGGAAPGMPMGARPPAGPGSGSGPAQAENKANAYLGTVAKQSMAEETPSPTMTEIQGARARASNQTKSDTAAVRTSPASPTSSTSLTATLDKLELAPLALKLPAPAFQGTPADFAARPAAKARPATGETGAPNASLFAESNRSDSERFDNRNTAGVAGDPAAPPRDPVPVLGEMPLLGRVFRTTTDEASTLQSGVKEVASAFGRPPPTQPQPIALPPAAPGRPAPPLFKPMTPLAVAQPQTRVSGGSAATGSLFSNGAGTTDKELRRFYDDSVGADQDGDAKTAEKTREVLAQGKFYTGLTRDDVGGRRYLYKGESAQPADKFQAWFLEDTGPPPGDRAGEQSGQAKAGAYSVTVAGLVNAERGGVAGEKRAQDALSPGEAAAGKDGRRSGAEGFFQSLEGDEYAKNPGPVDAARKDLSESEEVSRKLDGDSRFLERNAALSDSKKQKAVAVYEQEKLLSMRTNAVVTQSITAPAAPPVPVKPPPPADAPAKRAPAPVPTPQPEISTRANAFSTFSLNVSDVSFKLAGANLDNGALPDPGSIRVEEFLNAFNYRDPAPARGARLAFAWERARYPFAHNRDILRFAVQTAARGREAQKPLNLVILLDNSGSMERPDRVAILREALKVLASQLRPQDRISVIAFARTPRLWVDGMAGGRPSEFLAKVLELNPEGGTNLEAALDLAYLTAVKHYLAQGVNRVILLTDGAANLGNVEPADLKQKVIAHRQKGIALDCFGIGWEGYNDDLLEVLSRNGDGRYGFLNQPEQAAPEFADQLAGALNVAATDVKTQVEFNPRRVTAWRQIGYAKHQLTKEQFRDNTVDAAEIAAAESGNALYVIEVNPDGSGPLGVVRVRFKVPETGQYVEQEWPLPYQPQAPALDQSRPALRLAVTAAAFGEWLSRSPFAAEITLSALQSHLAGVPAAFAPDPRPERLAAMIRQAQVLAGK